MHFVLFWVRLAVSICSVEMLRFATESGVLSTPQTQRKEHRLSPASGFSDRLQAPGLHVPRIYT